MCLKEMSTFLQERLRRHQNTVPSTIFNIFINSYLQARDVVERLTSIYKVLDLISNKHTKKLFMSSMFNSTFPRTENILISNTN